MVSVMQLYSVCSLCRRTLSVGCGAIWCQLAVQLYDMGYLDIWCRLCGCKISVDCPAIWCQLAVQLYDGSCVAIWC